MPGAELGVEDLVVMVDLVVMEDLEVMVEDLPWLSSRPWPWWAGVLDPCLDLRATE